MAVDEEAKTASGRKGTSRRTFVKAALAGGASAAAVGVTWTQFLSPKSQSSGTPPTLTPPPVTQYGSYLVWFDAAAGTFRRKNLATGLDEAADANAGRVVQGAVDGLNPTVGGEIWISNDVDADDAIITIAKNNVSLVALRDPPPKSWDTPRPHLQKILYTGSVRGGLIEGLHCREIQFDGSGNQELLALRDVSMHPTSGPDRQGLRFLGGAGYIQYVEIHNLKIAMSGSGDSYSAIEFGNSNSGSGHITFTGNTSLETEYDASGSPVVIKISTGAETGTPIRFENLSIVELGSRKTGTAVRPILLQSQTEIHKGLRLMHIDRLFFEQHYTSPHTIVTIEPATGAGACWFVLTIDELVISDEIGKTVNLIDNQNTSWMSREQFLRVNGGFKGGVGTVAIGNPNLHQYFRLYLGSLSGITPFGKLTTPFFDSAPSSFVGAGGTSSTPTTGDYVVSVTPILVTSTAPWSLKDSAGNLIETVPASEARHVPLGYRVQFPSGTPSIFA